jgi:hypothetical protein
MAILPLNQGGTGSDLSGTGGANEFVKQTASGANLSVAAITTADIASAAVVQNPTAAQTITGQPLTLSNTAPLMLAAMEHIQYVDETLFRGGVDIGDEINRAYAALNTSLATTAAVLSGTTITLTMASNPMTFGFVASQTVYVSGFSSADSVFNGSFTIATISSTQMTFTVPSGSHTATSNGTVSFASGGTIYIAPKANGAPYGFTIPISFNAPGKYVVLEGLAPANQSGGQGTPLSMNGCTLNFMTTGGGAPLTLTSAAPPITATFNLTSVATSSGGTTVYTGTITGGGSNAFAGYTFVVLGFSSITGASGTYVCTASSGTTLTLVNSKVTAGGAGSGTATTLGGQTIYTGTITGGVSNGLQGKVFQIAGFTGNLENNGEFYCLSSTATTLFLANGEGATDVTGGTATQCTNTAIAYTNETPGSDVFATSQQIRNICLINGGAVASGHNGGPTTASQAIGIDFSGAARLSLQNVRIAGFAVGRVCLNPVSWGATDQNLTVAFNNTGTLFFNGMEMYKHIGGQIICNGTGHRTGGNGTAGGTSSLFSGVSWDSNTRYGLIESAGNGQIITFDGCHFENFGTVAITTRYVRTQTASIAILGGDALDDWPTGSAVPYWFSTASQGSNTALGGVSTMMVHGLQISSAGRTPTISGSAVGVFQVGGRGFLSGVNNSPTVLSPLYSANAGTGTVTSFFQNSANNATEANMEVSGNLTVDGTLTFGALTPFTPMPTGFTVVGTPVYTGQYQKIGKLVWWQIHIAPVSGSTIASTLGTSSFPVPNGPLGGALLAVVTVPFQITDLVTLNGVGTVVASGNIATPSFPANGNHIYLSGTYVTS